MKVYLAHAGMRSTEVLLHEEMQAMGYDLEHGPAELSVRPRLRLKQWLREVKYHYRHRRDFA